MDFVLGIIETYTKLRFVSQRYTPDIIIVARYI